MVNKITFPNKSSILYNSNSESFVGVGSVVVEEDGELLLVCNEAVDRLSATVSNDTIKMLIEEEKYYEKLNY